MSACLRSRLFSMVLVLAMALFGGCDSDTPSEPDSASAPDAGGDAVVADGPVADSAVTTPDTAAPDAAAPDALVPDLLVPDAPLPTCTDGKKNGSETDVDCGGGACPTCAKGSDCATGADCKSGVCDSSGTCAEASCTDSVKNGDETDIDCGGATCPKCADTKGCAKQADCSSGVCSGGICAKATCTDTVKNGDETDTDCGGATCPKCANTQKCVNATDCVSGICTSGVCQAPSCTDTVQNGDETDIDCGGTACGPCAATQKCNNASDCKSKVCTAGVCVAATCTDAVQNGDETDTDCGGATCPVCLAGKKCSLSGDCKSGVCKSGVCAKASCTDTVQNGDETDIDCGGATCAGCALGKACKGATDCGGGICDTNTCSLAISCKALLTALPSAKDGAYTIDPNKGSAADAYKVYCDMTTNGGGWTLVARVCASDAKDNWTYDASLWKDTKTLGDPMTLAKTDAKSAAYSQVPATQILIRDLGGKALAAHTYATTAQTWGAYLTSIWSKCGHLVSAKAAHLVDDNRDSVIGTQLYFRHYDGLVANCTSQERSMFAQMKTNAGYIEVGLGITQGNATYLDAQSAPKGATQYDHNITISHADYGLFVR